MKKTIILSVMFMFSCSLADAGIMRDLQNEIDQIGIAINTNEYTEKEIIFLQGKAEGIFLAMEMLHFQGIW